MKTSELTGAELDWAVAKCEGADFRVGDRNNLQIKMPDNPRYSPSVWSHLDYFNPSTNWSQGGPIIERERISIDSEPAFFAYIFKAKRYAGSTPLVAAMRCYVASKLGSEVDVPEELT